MILQQLTLRNFCLYRGEQVFDLTPARRNGHASPIVLVGGINGGGKTTLLDAVQLALYGPRARLSKRAKKTERASQENDVQRAKNELAEVEEEFARVGGPHWQQRESRRRELEDLQSRKRQAEGQLVSLAASGLPLALVSNLLARVQSQDAAERAAFQTQLPAELLAQRDATLVEALRRQGTARAAVSAVEQWQDQDRATRTAGAQPTRRLELSDAARSLLATLRDRWLAQSAAEAQGLLDELHRVERESDGLERSLKATPEEAARRAKLAVRTQQTMRDFLQRATASKIDRLSRLVTDSFRFLLRKESLVQRVQIDPATFAISLFDAAGQAVPKQRLSEGEKQIFAVSVLWGLAQASPRPLPAIIDTPMARLDGVHRQHLVERYFPHASHPVISLSTDTEVDQPCFEVLRPHIARAYHLNYSEADRCTVAEEGYFWKG